MTMLKVGIAAVLAVFGMSFAVAPVAHAVYDPCKSAAELNAEGGNFAEFSTDEGPVSVPCQESAPEPTPTPTPTPTKVEAAEVPVVIVEKPSTPTVQETPTVVVQEQSAPSPAPVKDKPKKEKKPKKDKPVVKVVTPTVIQPKVETPALDKTVEDTAALPDEVVVGVVDTPAETVVTVEPAAIPQGESFPWIHVYGTAAIVLAAAALFVATRRKSCSNNE